VVSAKPKVQANALTVEIDINGNGSWRGGTGCVPADADYTYTYISVSPPSNGCVKYEPSGGGGNLHEINGLGGVGLFHDAVSCGPSCWTNNYRTGIRGWWTDLGSGRTLEAPASSTDSSWPADGSGTPTRIQSDMPPRPERGGATADKIGQVLHDHPALRKEIVYVLNRQDPEDQTAWTVTTVDDGPAVGRATVPDCTGVSYEACVTRLHAAGFDDVTQYTFPETILDAADGEVVDTDPESGDSVDPETTPVTIGVNPPTATKTQRDERCETGEGPQPDPGPPLPDGTALPQYQTIEMFSSLDASGDLPPYPPMMIPLRYGAKKWGWRKIKMVHGYGTLDAEQTRLALEVDSAPTPAKWASRNQREFHYTYSVAVGSETIQCVRSAIVEYAPDPNGRFRGVTNSYQGALVQP
jgi:hypothetical protein